MLQRSLNTTDTATRQESTCRNSKWGRTRYVQSVRALRTALSVFTVSLQQVHVDTKTTSNKNAGSIPVNRELVMHLSVQATGDSVILILMHRSAINHLRSSPEKMRIELISQLQYNLSSY
jgi:hypothetical protein